MAKKSDLNKPTPAEERAVLELLSQQSAAWLVGITARTLRDHPDAPRNSDQSYNGAEVVKWSQSRVKSIELGDAEIEKLLVIAEEIFPHGHLPAVVATMRDLKIKHGSSGLVALAETLLQEWSAELARHPGFDEPLDDSAIQEELLATRETLYARQASARLHTATICETCNRLRRGRNWIKAPVPSGFAVLRGHCPDCEDK